MKLAELAEKTFARIERGEANLEIERAAGLDIAQAGDVTFLANPKYTPQIQETRASAIFLNEKEKIERADLAVLRAKDPYLAYTRALRLFNPEPETASFVHPKAFVDETAQIAETVEIHANSVVGANCRIESQTKIFPNVTIYDNVKIGRNCTIHAGVSIRENCEIGDNVIIHNNTTIGSDGFGYAKDEEKRWLKIPQTGRVVIEDDVEIGANSAIDCASVGETRIKRGVKIDNLVQIGHNSRLGKFCIMAGNSGLAGSVTLGNGVMIGGSASIKDHLTIGDRAIVGAGSGVAADVEAGKTVLGYPAVDARQALKQWAILKKLAAQ